MATRLAPSERFVVAVVAAAPEPMLIARTQQQQRPFWCWAACVAMVKDAPIESQCEIAGQQLKVPPCCPAVFVAPSVGIPAPFKRGDCDEPLNPGEFVSLWDDHDVTAEPVDRPLEKPEVITCLAAQQPVQVLQGDGEGQHVLLIVGRKGEDHFLIADPLFDGPTPASTTLDELRRVRGGWRESWILTRR
jgi:hypothetical protein